MRSSACALQAADGVGDRYTHVYRHLIPSSSWGSIGEKAARDDGLGQGHGRAPPGTKGLRLCAWPRFPLLQLYGTAKSLSQAVLGVG